jgi:tetratricopeptide (TPR) repeat protein
MNGTNKRNEMPEMLITTGLSLLLAIGIGDTIALAGLANGLIGRIGKKDAFGIQKKALDKTIKEAGGAEAKDILKSLKDDNKLLRELHERLDVSEETRRSLVSQYFNGRGDVLENLAKNYYELFCKAAIKKDGAFKEFVVTGLMGLKTQGIITNEAVKNVERYLEEITEDLKRIKEAESRQFSITSDLNEVRSEISGGKPEIGYVERDEIKEVKDALKTTNKLIVTGKPGAGKTRFMLRVLEDFDCDSFVVIRRFFRVDGITTLDAELQEFDSFVVVWDDLHKAKDDLVQSAIKQIEQLAREKDSRFLFISTSRASDKYYGFEPREKEISLEDFRSLELVEGCAAHFGVSVKDEVREKILLVGDGTPLYVISLFFTSEAQGKKEIIPKDLQTLPENSFTIWRDHLRFLEDKGGLSANEQQVLRSIALAMHAVGGIDFETVKAFYEHVFRGDPHYFEGSLEKVTNKFFVGNEGKIYFMHAVQVKAVERVYPLKGRHIQKLSGVLASLERDESGMLLWGFALWLYGIKRYEESLKFWDAFMKKEPNRADAYSNRGTVYAGLNQHERAIEDYDMALELNPEYAEAYINRGTVYAGLNQHERAIEDYDMAVELNPEDAEAYYNRGNAYARLNQHERAIEDYDMAVELNPEDAEAHNNRGAAYARLNQHERAIEDYARAVELNPGYAEAYANRGIAYTLIAKYDKSTRDLKRSGVLFLKSGGADDAAKSFNLCFNLRDKIRNDDVIYCGLAAYLLNLDADVPIEIRKMQAEDRVLERIVDLTLRKLKGEDVSDEIEEMERKDAREEIKMLLDMLKIF